MVQFSFQLLDKGNPVFQTYIVCTSLLIIKCLLMSPLTAFHRFRTKVRVCFGNYLKFVEKNEFVFRSIDTSQPRRCEHSTCIRNANRTQWIGWTCPKVVYFQNEFFSGKSTLLNQQQKNLHYRAHLNDLENILPYLTAGLFYVLTNPNPMLANTLFPLTTVARFVHTFVYAVYVVPQPARAIAFAIHIFITFFMACMSIIYFI